uniref:Uncharacterized protein n=1 Tax=Marseillevirus sp. TaxID=2809551 RepID=A0AA96IY72_9VIRU|nr:hypothetical protein MarFTMF_390 [Marseillevirus sp.]
MDKEKCTIFALGRTVWKLIKKEDVTEFIFATMG